MNDTYNYKLMPLHSDSEEYMQNGSITETKIAESFETLNKIQLSPHYLKLVKYPDQMTYENLVSSLIELEIEQEKAKKEKTYEFVYHENPAFDPEECATIKGPIGCPIGAVGVKGPKGISCSVGPKGIPGPTGCPELDAKLQKEYEVKNFDMHGYPIDSPEPPSPDKLLSPIIPNKYDHTNEFKKLSDHFKSKWSLNELSTNTNGWFNFLDCDGVVSSQELIIKNNSKNFQKLRGNMSEVFVCDIKGKHEGITNIGMAIHGGTAYDKVECVLKVDDAVICSKTIMIKSYVSSCTFIKFPNLMVLYPNNKVSICVRGSTMTVLNPEIKFFIKYDAIYFGTKSRNKIMNKHVMNEFLFKTTSDVLIANINGTYAVRYYTQLVNSVDKQFRHLYKPEKLQNDPEPIKVYETEDIAFDFVGKLVINI